MRQIAKKIVWGVTGAGDFLTEVIGEMQKLREDRKVEITTCLSKSARMVVNWYKLTERINDVSNRVLVEQNANSPFIAGPLQIGKYHSFLVAPATANTVAKIVHGIADTLITNAVAQAQKGGAPIIILPVDQKLGEQTTLLPSGKKMKLKMRKIDITNFEKLKTMQGITVIHNPKELRRIYN